MLQYPIAITPISRNWNNLPLQRKILNTSHILQYYRFLFFIRKSKEPYFKGHVNLLMCLVLGSFLSMNPFCCYYTVQRKLIITKGSTHILSPTSYYFNRYVFPLYTGCNFIDVLCIILLYKITFKIEAGSEWNLVIKILQMRIALLNI